MWFHKFQMFGLPIIINPVDCECLLIKFNFRWSERDTQGIKQCVHHPQIKFLDQLDLWCTSKRGCFYSSQMSRKSGMGPFISSRRRTPSLAWWRLGEWVIVIQVGMSGQRRSDLQSRRSRPSTNWNPDLASLCCVETWSMLCLVRFFITGN